MRYRSSWPSRPSIRATFARKLQASRKKQKHEGYAGRASKGDNRIWLTAARDDKVSFGCGAEFALTYFDQCLIAAWPKSKTWKQLFDRTSTCVRLKEAELSEGSSLPQAFFGAGVKDLELP